VLLYSTEIDPKEILAELIDIRTHEVDEMIRQRVEDRTLYGQEFSLTSA